MGEQLLDGDLRFFRRVELGEVRHHRAIEVKLPRFLEDHRQRCRGDDFGERCQIVKRVGVDRRRTRLIPVDVAVAFHVGDVAVATNGDRDTRRNCFLDRGLDDFIELPNEGGIEAGVVEAHLGPNVFDRRWWGGGDLGLGRGRARAYHDERYDGKTKRLHVNGER